MLGAIKLVSLSLHKTFYTLLVKCTTHQEECKWEGGAQQDRATYIATFKGQDSGVTLFWVELCGWRRTERGMSCHPPAFLRPRLVPSSLLVFYNRNNKVLIKFNYMKTNMTVHEDEHHKWRRGYALTAHCWIEVNVLWRRRTRFFAGKFSYIFCTVQFLLPPRGTDAENANICFVLVSWMVRWVRLLDTPVVHILAMNLVYRTPCGDGWYLAP